MKTAPLATVALALSLLPFSPATAAPRPRHFPVGGMNTAVRNFLFHPGEVDGANDWACRPSRRHPRPVVLVHGTFANLGANWTRIAPTLANRGHCVFAFNYGMNRLSARRIGGLADIADSAAEMKRFVTRVLRATGAKKVDVVGHSQGGMMPNHYLKRLGGAARVHTFVALAPSNHGTTANGLVTLIRELKLQGFTSSAMSAAGLPAIAQQEVGSSFQEELFGDGDTVKGPRYVVITTARDSVVTPYTSAFLKGARNIVIQDQCPMDMVGHSGLAFDGPAVQNVVNALGKDREDFRARC